MTTPNPDFKKKNFHDPERPQLACVPIAMQFATRVAMHVVMKQVSYFGGGFSNSRTGFSNFLTLYQRFWCTPQQILPIFSFM
jgi:hypothetical protein